MVSILLPFYNRESYLPEALRSIEKQTYKNYQVIFYDDGSTDNSNAIATEWRKKHNGILIRSEQNRGVGHARNVLLDHVDTEYACWLDSDDYAHPDRLKKQVEYLEKNKDVDVAFSYLRFCKSDVDHMCKSGVYKVDPSVYVNRDSLVNNMSFATAMFRQKVCMYKFNEVRRKEDVEWIVSMIGKVNFGIVKEDLYHVRKHDNRLTIPE